MLISTIIFLCFGNNLSSISIRWKGLSNNDVSLKTIGGGPLMKYYNDIPGREVYLTRNFINTPVSQKFWDEAVLVLHSESPVNRWRGVQKNYKIFTIFSMFTA